MRAGIIPIVLILAIFSVTATEDIRDFITSCLSYGPGTIGTCANTYDRSTTDLRYEQAGASEAASSFTGQITWTLNQTVVGHDMTLMVQADENQASAQSGDFEDCNLRLMSGTTTVYNISFNQADNLNVYTSTNITFSSGIDATFNKVNLSCTPTWNSGSGKSYMEIEEIVILGEFFNQGINQLPIAELDFDSPQYVLIPTFPITVPVNITATDDEGDAIYYATSDSYGFTEDAFGYEQTYGTDCEITNWAEGIGNAGYWAHWYKGNYLKAFFPGMDFCSPESFFSNSCYEPVYTMNVSESPFVWSKNGNCALGFKQYSKEIMFKYQGSTEITRYAEFKIGMEFSAYSRMNITLYNQHIPLMNFSVYSNGTQLDVRQGSTTYWNQSRYQADSGGNLRNSFIQLKVASYANGTVKVLRGTIPPSSEYLIFSTTVQDPWTEIGFAGEFLESMDDFKITYPGYETRDFSTTKPTTCTLENMGWNYCKYYISDSYHQPTLWRTYTASIEVLPSSMKPQLLDRESNLSVNERTTAVKEWRNFWTGITLSDGESFDKKVQSYFFWMFALMFLISVFGTKDFMFSWFATSAVCLIIALVQGWTVPAVTMIISISAAIAFMVRP